MSLIFKALQTVGQTGKTPAQGLGNSTPQQAVRRWRRWLGSALVTLAAAGLFVSGIVAAYAVNVFTARGKPLTPVVAAASSPQEMGRPSGQSAIKAPALEAVSSAMQTPGAIRKITFHARSSGAAVDQPSGPPPSAGPVRFYPARLHPLPEPANAVEEMVTVTDAARPPASMDRESSIGDAPPPKDKSTTRELAALQDRAAVSQWVSGQRPQPSESGALDRPAAEDASVAPSETAAKGFPHIDRKRQSAQAVRHRKISRLAHNILSAIQAGDFALSSDLIRQMVRIKGPQNDFVLKLKAYFLIRQERLEEARKLLTRVLAHNANDLEAGLNMAVIAIKSGRYDPARQRLTHLQELYPEEARIGSYLRQLSR